VEELQKRNQDSFTIPEWFVYTSRAFITLEGVSLQADESYSLIQSCFPYIAKRLLKDDSPRAQKALKELLYGAGDMIDVEQIANLAEGFSTYTTTTKSLNSANTTSATGGQEAPKDAKTKVDEAEAAITLAKDSADVLLDPKGNLIQNLLVEEGALAASARFKDDVKNSLVDGPQRFRDSLPFGAGGFLPPLPFEVAVAPFLRKTEAEEKAQQLLGKLGGLVRAGGGDGDRQLAADPTTLNELINDLQPEQAALIVKEFRENLPSYTGLVGQLGTKFVGKLLEKASENIETTLAEMVENGQGDELLAVAARGVSSVAQQGAKTIQSREDEKAGAPLS
jgi:hypothetical protein